MDLATRQTGTTVSRRPKLPKQGSSSRLSLRMIRVKHIIVALLLSIFSF